jgi:ribosomal protein S12 methylthiotransferase
MTGFSERDMKVYITSLGCPKNLVDTEATLSLLREEGCALTEDCTEADVMIVNACSFLDASWRETIEEVERLGRVREGDGSKKLVVMGCLPRHRDDDWRRRLPHVDRFVPAGEHARLPALVRAWRNGGGVKSPLPRAAIDPFAGFERRTLLTPPHTAYVKIAEGCSRRCSFCAIPRIRGKMISRTLRSIVDEVESLRNNGLREVCLLAQDITSYGYDGRRFADLVDAIASTGVDWIRIYYVHPGSLSLDLARRLFDHPSVCRYLESPIQHASDRILKRMRRPYTRERLSSLFSGIRREFPDIRVRSEVIVGFPGEEERDFEELKRFVEEMEFASLGIFAYSPEANTPAASLDGVVPDDVKRARAAELSDLQDAITFGLHDAERGAVHSVLVDRLRDDSSGDGYPYAGRYYGQAPEVDGEVLIKGEGLATGEFVSAVITDADVFDLRGEVA